MEKSNTIQRTAQEITLEGEIDRLRKRLAVLQAEHDAMAFILDSVPDYVSYVNADLTYQVCNRKYEIETGRTREAFLGKHVVEFMGEQGFAKIQQHVERVLKGELVTYEDRIDYRYLAQQDVQVQYAPHRSKEGAVIGFSVYVRNSTARRRAEEMLRRQAQHDPLTDLPNRILFNERLGQAIGRANRIRSQLAVLFIDLDGFKQVNDVLGHESGDQVLRDVARNLSQTLRSNDILARIGGDEFVLLVEDLQGLEQVKILADKMIESITHLRTPALQKVRISASIGIALYPDHGSDTRILLVRADEAMYQAKRHGKGCYFLYGEGVL
ncbi:MAG: GGDEF domain-containing protein [Gammaproteobacteria bacterium (ex Lamellibrachia satsuma)]|nr:MAG: GGDEF domain-containing protein [Gammaproteobacteria bacterium (ex Lamellibrachia satsuma)]